MSVDPAYLLPPLSIGGASRAESQSQDTSPPSSNRNHLHLLMTGEESEGIPTVMKEKIGVKKIGVTIQLPPINKTHFSVHGRSHVLDQASRSVGDVVRAFGVHFSGDGLSWIRTSHPSGSRHWRPPHQGRAPAPGSLEPQKCVGSLPCPSKRKPGQTTFSASTAAPKSL